MDNPTPIEVDQAFHAGFQSIDNGDGFYFGFQSHLLSLGYQFKPDAPCTCSDRGQHGHMPECRWIRDASTPGNGRATLPRHEHTHD